MDCSYASASSSSSSCCSNNSSSNRVSSLLIADIRGMKQRERHYETGDYLHAPELLLLSMNSSSNGKDGDDDDPVDVECRTKMIDWCVQIIDHCRFSRETVAVAIKLLDRFLQRTNWVVQDRSAFQLAAITSLYTAIKIHEPQAISVQTMVTLSRNAYSASQIKAMERLLLEVSTWLVHPPTSFIFAHCYCQLLSAAIQTEKDQGYRYDQQGLLDLTKLQLESTLNDYELSLVPASSVAFAAVMNAMEGMSICISSQQQEQLETMLASAAEIDMDAISVKAIQDAQLRLYQGLLVAGSSDMSLSSPSQRTNNINNSDVQCESSVPVRPSSPRSVQQNVSRHRQ